MSENAAGPAEPSPDETGYTPPELPPTGANLGHIVVPLTVVWFVLWVVLLFLRDELHRHDAMNWYWTSLAGWVLGLIGLSIYFWQRLAARRGGRAANAMALAEKF